MARFDNVRAGYLTISPDPADQFFQLGAFGSKGEPF
jgi:hypothetical protein